MNATDLRPLTAAALGWGASDWQALLHDRRAERGVLAAAEATLASAAADAIVAAMGDELNDSAGGAVRAGAASAAGLLGRGIFAHLYGDPEPLTEGPAWAQATAKAIAGLPGIEEAREAVAADPDLSALAAASMLRAAAEEVREIVDRLLDEGQIPDEDPADADGEAAVGAAAAQAGGVGSALRVAARQAPRDAADAAEALNGILPGLGSAPAAHEQPDPGRLHLIELLRKDDRLRRIMRIAGRIRRIAERVQRQRSDNAREEVVDVERGADLGRILPSELVGLRHPILRKLRLKALAERSMLQYRLAGTEPLGKGPIVALLDVSGSTGDKLADGLRRIDWIAAVGIACVRAGVEQRRQVAIATFDDVVLRTWRLDWRDRDACQRAILEIAGIRPCGGTSFDGPITWALDAGAERDRADLVLVTDGFGDVYSDTARQRLQEAQGRGLRLWGVLAGEGGFGEALGALCTGVVAVDTSTQDAGLEIGSLGAT
jgi:uncharacterized protein with von Willebrand factor type A (vWA) domain